MRLAVLSTGEGHDGGTSGERGFLPCGDDVLRGWYGREALLSTGQGVRLRERGLVRGCSVMYI